MPPRIPTQSDFDTHLPSSIPLSLHFPSPPESTTTFLILLHGLGDHELPFARFAQNLNLPGVLAIAPRGVHPLPDALVPDGPASSVPMSHWGDDLLVNHDTGELDDDPGFERASKVVLDEIVDGFLVRRFGWDTSDVLLFGFGQGGSLALGLAARLSHPSRVVDVTDNNNNDDTETGPRSFKGAVSIGGPLPQSLVSTVLSRSKSRTSVLAVQLDQDAVEAVRQEFADVQVVRWKRRGVDMPRDREEALSLIRFFADRLNSSGPNLGF